MKKLLSLALLICLLLVLPMEGRAADVVDSGQCGDNLTWTLTSDCVLTISGTGDMWDSDYWGVPPWGDYLWIDCHENGFYVKSVVIKEGVTSIGDASFHDCSDMIAVSIPNSVTSIGEHAFEGCTSLQSVALPANLTYMGLQAFANCNTLETIVIPGSVKTVGEQAFFECIGLKEAVVSEGVESLAKGAFIGCINLRKVQLPSTLKEIAPETFAWCESLTKITIPNGIAQIGFSAFQNCISMVSVELPDSLTHIDTDAFMNCESLATVTIPENVKTAGDGIFDGVTATVNYPLGNPIWTKDKFADYCGDITWVSYCYHRMTEIQKKVDPTCIDKGYTGDKVCTACGKVMEIGKGIPAKGHTEVVDKAVAATCEKTGLTEGKHCSVCNAITVKQETVPAKGHSFGQWKQTKAPTCTEKGTETRSCACGKTESRDVAAKGHTEVVDKAVAATCEKTGLTEGKHCSVCNAITVKQETVPAKGHSFGQWKQTKAPTCTEKGTETRSCACGKTESRDVAAKGHTEVVDKAVAATCEKTGLTEGKHCSVCNAVTVKQETVPAKGHSWDGGKVTKEATETAEGEKLFTCTACKQTKTESVPKLNHVHKYTDKVTAPTCTEKGYTTHTCACGDSYTDSETAAKGHSWDGGKVTKEATETAEGEKLFTCTACKQTKTESVPKLNHVHKYTDKVTAPTCTEKGYTTHTCACGDSYTDSETAAKGHSWDGGKVTKEATETAEGEKLFTCTACKQTKTESVPKLNHVHKYTDKVTAPTCTEKGYTTHTCACGDSYTDSETAAKGHSFETGKCTACGESDPDWVEPTQPTEPEPTEPEPTEPQPTEPEDTEITRLAGAHRYETAFLTADQMKVNLGIEKFNAVVVASGTNFADALSGSYLAAVKDAPILLACDVEWVNDLTKDYIRKNLNPGGTVHILGGEGAVPASFESGLDGFHVARLAGANRFDTNLMVLKEAGVGDKPVLVCTGLSFADSLSASAAELPILLVWKDLTVDQKAFLAGLNGNELYVIGGESAVSTALQEQVAQYGVTERVQGANRFETSIAIAERFFYKPESAVLAYAWNFPDGLCGGALAVSMKAPLILTMERYETRAAEYIQGQPITSATILGGETLIPDSSVQKIFSTK